MNQSLIDHNIHHNKNIQQLMKIFKSLTNLNINQTLRINLLNNLKNSINLH